MAPWMQVRSDGESVCSSETVRKVEIRVIWIDALCINQADLEEGTEQVIQMRDIYEGCEDVIMWLGDRNGEVPSELQPWNGPEADKFNWTELADSGVGSDEILATFTIMYMLSSDKHINELPCFKLGQNSC
jgi:hypothetical protein